MLCGWGWKSPIFGAAFAFVVPATVVTCGGRMIDEGEVRGTSATNTEDAGVAVDPRGVDGGAGSAPTSTATTTSTSTPTGLPTFPTATATSTESGFGDFRPLTFLNQYEEPDWLALGLGVPSPSTTVTVPSPCEDRTEMCDGQVSREAWMRQLLAACESEFEHCGDAILGFAPGESCATHTIVWGMATDAFARCVATLAYHTSCAADPPTTDEDVITDVECPH